MTRAEDDCLVGNLGGAGAGDGDAHAVNVGVVSYDGIDRFAVIAPAGIRYAAVQSLARRHARRRGRAIARDNREMLLSISAELFLIAVQEGDPFSIGRPFRTRAVGSIVSRRQKFLGGARGR